jgi:hypothetical protein
MQLFRIAGTLFVACVLSFSVQAQDIEIACDGSPTAAALRVPAPADRFVHVLCTKYGHVLAPTAGWFWTPPGTYSPQFYPAQMVRENPLEVGNGIYFTSITATSLEGAAASDRWRILGGLFRDPPPTKALEIVASSSGGSKHTIYIFPNSWGYSCSPECTKEGAFIMVSQRKEPPQW